MKHLFGFFLSLCLYQETLSQFKISGNISDNLGNPVAEASVSIGLAGLESSLFFTRTDSIGKYQFWLSDSFSLKTLIIRVNAFGYIKSNALLYPPFGKKNFRLEPEIAELPSVVVTDNPVRIRKKGDTLSYNVKGYSNPLDRVIGDVIKKLPGIVVEENGRIYYNGVPINNFYIDGDNLLDDKYSLATRTIPYGMVDKVQVIENNQDIKALSGIVSTDRAAINITLNDKSRLHFLTDVNLSGGFPSQYNASISTMAFKTRFKTLNVLKSNNIGKDLEEEIQSDLQTNGDLLPYSEQARQLLNVDKIDDLGFTKQRYLFNHAKLASINTLFKPQFGQMFKLNGYLFQDIQDQNFSNFTKLILPGNTIQHTETNKLSDHLLNGRLGLTFNINTKKVYFNNTLSYENTENKSFTNALINSVGSEQELQDNKINITNSLNGLIVLKKNKIIQFTSAISYLHHPQNLIFSPGLFMETVNNNSAYQQLNQSVQMPGLTIHNFVTFRENYRQWLHSFKIGVSYENRKLLSSIQLLQLNGMISNGTDSFSNNLKYHKWDVYLENEFQWQRRGLRATFSLPLHKLMQTYTDSTFNTSTKDAFVLFQPSVQFLQKIGKESNLSFRYFYNKNFGTYYDFFKGKIIENYRSIAYNDLSFLASLQSQHSLTLGYSYRNTLKILFLNLAVSYKKFNSGNLLSSDITDYTSRTVAIPIDNHTTISTINANVSKYLFFLKSTMNLGLTARFRSTPVLQNGYLFHSENRSNLYSFGIYTKITNWLFTKYETYFSNSVSKNPFAKDETRIYQNKQLAYLDIISDNSFTLRITAEGYRIQQPDKSRNTFYFLDATLRKRFTKPAIMFELGWYNINNANTYTANTIYSNSFSSSQVEVRPSSLMLSVSFSF